MGLLPKPSFQLIFRYSAGIVKAMVSPLQNGAFGNMTNESGTLLYVNVKTPSPTAHPIESLIKCKSSIFAAFNPQLIFSHVSPALDVYNTSPASPHIHPFF